MRSLSETVRLDARTKLLNPKWYEGMLSSGYEGVREIQKRLTNTMGWSATSGMVDNWVYDEVGGLCRPHTALLCYETLVHRAQACHAMPCTQPCPALASRLWRAPAAALTCLYYCWRAARRPLARANSHLPTHTVAPHVTLPSSYPHPQANATFIEDPEMAQRLMDANPNSFRKLVRPPAGLPLPRPAVRARRPHHAASRQPVALLALAELVNPVFRPPSSCSNLQPHPILPNPPTGGHLPGGQRPRLLGRQARAAGAPAPDVHVSPQLVGTEPCRQQRLACPPRLACHS